MSKTAEISYWALLHALPGMGPVTFRRLLDRFGSAAEVVEKADRDTLAEVRGMRGELADALLACRNRLDTAERMVAALQKKGVRLLRMTDSDYPAALLDLPDPPPLLYVLGDIGAQDRRAVSMVGTTKPSPRGRPIAEEFGKRFAAAGVTVVSGYAHGIDAASHRGAFKGGGRSILCIPYGIRHFKSRADFPALAEIAQRGAVVSECPPDLEWSASAAVARDRIIAALGRAVFVIETRPRGGTLHTVRAAEQLGRPLFVLKYRTPPESARGNSILIARGATDVSMFGEIGKVFDCLGPDPRHGGGSA
jgi:DNA processing protein